MTTEELTALAQQAAEKIWYPQELLGRAYLERLILDALQTALAESKAQIDGCEASMLRQTEAFNAENDRLDAELQIALATLANTEWNLQRLGDERDGFQERVAALETALKQGRDAFRVAQQQRDELQTALAQSHQAWKDQCEMVERANFSLENALDMMRQDRDEWRTLYEGTHEFLNGLWY